MSPSSTFRCIHIYNTLLCSSSNMMHCYHVHGSCILQFTMWSLLNKITLNSKLKTLLIEHGRETSIDISVKLKLELFLIHSNSNKYMSFILNLHSLPRHKLYTINKNTIRILIWLGGSCMNT